MYSEVCKTDSAISIPFSRACLIAVLLLLRYEWKQNDRYTERFTFLAAKTVVIKQSSTGMNPSGVQEVGSNGAPLISRATKMVKIWIPGKKFTKSGVNV